MVVLTTEDLANLGISSNNTDNFTFRGKEFRIGTTFSLKMRAAAINFCERQEQQGTECLLVERATAVTVWTEVEKVEKVEKIEKPVQQSQDKLDPPAFIERCHQELTKSIGPMASLIIEDLVNTIEPLTRDRAIEWIAAQIPNSQLADEFKRNMKK